MLRALDHVFAVHHVPSRKRNHIAGHQQRRSWRDQAAGDLQTIRFVQCGVRALQGLLAILAACYDLQHVTGRHNGIGFGSLRIKLLALRIEVGSLRLFINPMSFGHEAETLDRAALERQRRRSRFEQRTGVKNQLSAAYAEIVVVFDRYAAQEFEVALLFLRDPEVALVGLVCGSDYCHPVASRDGGCYLQKRLVLVSQAVAGAEGGRNPRRQAA